MLALLRYRTFLEILAVIAIVLTVVALWMILQKTGHNGALSLIALIPFASVVLLLWLAFSEWPIMKTLREKEALAASAIAQVGGGAPPAAAAPVTAPMPAVAPAPAPAPEAAPPAEPPAPTA